MSLASKARRVARRKARGVDVPLYGVSGEIAGPDLWGRVLDSPHRRTETWTTANGTVVTSYVDTIEEALRAASSPAPMPPPPPAMPAPSTGPRASVLWRFGDGELH